MANPLEYARAKSRFVRRLLRHRLHHQPKVCPYCGPSSALRLMRHKKLIMDILECDTCRLIFRWPVDTPQEHDTHYQHEYFVDAPQVVLPAPQELQALTNRCFAGSHLDLNPKIRLLKTLRPAGRVLDFGCSWGYGIYQLRSHGYDATGFEISKPRAEYARQQLKMKVFGSIDELQALPPGSFDIIFSNHVVEHLPNISDALRLMARLLVPGGLAFHVLPNFTGATARTGIWLKWIGEDHPIAPTIAFFEYAIPRSGLERPLFASSPFNEELAMALNTQPAMPRSVDGDELLVVAYKAA
ncbi:MAG: class I SAM-dependent methyltransferase [Candidatus Acidiferrales bacterium]